MQEVVKMMYILVETDDTSSISSPLKTTNRIKFLAFAASENILVFGASSGGLYVYHRESFTFKSLVPSKEGPVTCVKISPDEKWFGFSTSRGVSCVLEHSGSSVNRRILSHVHEGRKVTAMLWNNGSSQLYVGDDTGQISVISTASYLTPAVALMQLDSAVVQLDTINYMLLASTLTRSYICDTFREQYRQIGSRVRDGEFGACFYHVDLYESFVDATQDLNHDQKDSHGPFSSLNDGEWLLADKNLQNVKLYCARPGLRLWEVRVDGAVISTHQFKQLRSTSPVNVLHPPAVDISSKAEDSSESGHLLQFSKLLRVSNKYLLTYDSNGLCVLDPMTSEVILWTSEFKNIVDVHVVSEVMYIWMGGSRLHAVSLTPIDKFLVRMYLQKKYLYCAQLCAAHASILKKLVHVSLKMHVLADLLQKIKEEEIGRSLDEDTVKKVRELLEHISKNVQSQEQAQMLKSGIFIVGNAHLLSRKEEFRTQKSLNHISEKQLNDVDIFPNLGGKQNSQHQEVDQIDGETVNDIFQNNNLSSMSSLLVNSQQSSANNNDDYDPFPDLPLSSLTSAETIMALKNLTTTVSGTISSGTKSLKEKWQNFEEKLRGQEEGGLSVEKSINRHKITQPNLLENNKEDEENEIISAQKKETTLLISSLIETCNQLTRDPSCDMKRIEELQFAMLESFAVLYEKFRSHLQESLKGGAVNTTPAKDQSSVNNFPKWFNSRDIMPFPFHDYFVKEILTTLSHHFQACLKSGSLVNWIGQFLSHIELDYALFPAHIGRIHNKNSLLLDQALGRFLEMCSGLLDPHSSLESLEDSGSSCHYFSWNVIMDHFQKSSSLGTTSKLDEDGLHTWPLPRTLNTMLVLFQLGQVESCRNIGEHVPIQHVLRAVLRLKEDSVQISKLFLLYIEKVPMVELLAKFEDPEVYYFTRHAFESLYNTEPGSQCTCGFPIKTTKFQNTFYHVGQTLLSHIYMKEGLTEAVSLCQRTEVLWHHLLVLRRSQEVEEVLPLILHVASVEELKSRCSDFSPSTWDLVFQLRVKFEEGYCLNCNVKVNRENPSATIPWMLLAFLLLRETTVNFALTLLSKYASSIPVGSIGPRFYQNCLLASMAESQSAELKKVLLEAVADSNTMPVISQKLSGKLGLPHSPGLHHWGIQLQLSKTNCLCCLLPLGSKTSSRGSIVSFQCCHSFHSICLQQRLLKQCPICVKN